jgi:hypothetical protein
VCRTEIYSGTAMRERLSAEGRLQGDWRSWGYRMRDEQAEVMFRIMRVALHERALAIDSILNRLISLSFSRQIHETLYPSEISRRLSERVHDVGVQVRKDTVSRLREALEFARGNHDKAAVRRFAIERGLTIGAWDMPKRAEVERLWNHLHTRGRMLSGTESRVTSPLRASFSVAAGS